MSMKVLLLSLSLILLNSNLVTGQSKYKVDHTLFIGTSITSDPSSNVFVQFEAQSKWVQLQGIYLTDLRGIDQRLNLKLGFRSMNYKNCEMWIYMPYFNSNIRERFAYNTPFSFEFRWKKQLSLIFDTSGPDGRFEIRYRTKLLKL